MEILKKSNIGERIQNHTETCIYILKIINKLIKILLNQIKIRFNANEITIINLILEILFFDIKSIVK